MVARCPNCNSNRIVLADNEYVCQHCGVVLGKTVEEKRTEMPENIWSYSRQKGAETSSGQTDIRLILLIDSLGQELVLPQSIRGTALNEARRLQKTVKAKHMHRRLSVNDLAALGIYVACRMAKFPRSLKEISKAFEKRGVKYPPNHIFSVANRIDLKAPEEDVTVCLSHIVRKVMNAPEASSKLPRDAPFIEYTNALMDVAGEILKEAKLPGRNPWTLAAGALVLADEFLADGRNVINKDVIIDRALIGRANLLNTIKRLRQIEFNFPDELKALNNKYAYLRKNGNQKAAVHPKRTQGSSKEARESNQAAAGHPKRG